MRRAQVSAVRSVECKKNDTDTEKKVFFSFFFLHAVLHTKKKSNVSLIRKNYHFDVVLFAFIFDIHTFSLSLDVEYVSD